jgi:hypothetical protein
MTADRLPIAPRRLSEERQEALHPAVDGAPIHDEPALGHPLDEVGVTDAIPHIPADR